MKHIDYMVLFFMSILSVPIPGNAQQDIYSFFEELYQDSKYKFQETNRDAYHSFINMNSLQDIPANRNAFIRISYLHELFTSATAADGSREGLLEIPYFWHWTEPNPRLEIFKGETLLSKIPAERYASFAMLDRTPEIFLSDLVDSMYYSHPEYGTFYSFGWCSEREMSYRSIIRHWGFKSKVIAYGGHSWTEIEAEFINTRQERITLYLSVDNTFNILSWNKNSDETELLDEEKRLQRWYNKKSNYDVKVEVTAFNRQRIRWLVRKYL
jgi:hypothetical protein